MTTRTRRQSSRIRVLDAAVIVFREMGFKNAQVEAIAMQAGVTRKTVYNLFGTKEDLAEACIAYAGAQAEPLYTPAIQSGMPAMDLLAKILQDSADWCMANPDLAMRALAPRVRPSLETSDGASFQGIVTEVMRLGQTQGVIRKDETAGLLALVLLGLFGQAMLSSLASGHLGAGEIDRIVRIAVEGIGA